MYPEKIKLNNQIEVFMLESIIIADLDYQQSPPHPFWYFGKIVDIFNTKTKKSITKNCKTTSQVKKALNDAFDNGLKIEDFRYMVAYLYGEAEEATFHKVATFEQAMQGAITVQWLSSHKKSLYRKGQRYWEPCDIKKNKVNRHVIEIDYDKETISLHLEADNQQGLDAGNQDISLRWVRVKYRD